MSVEQLLQYLAWGIYLLLFLVVLRRAIRHPLRVYLDLALVFSTPAAIIAIGLLAALGVIHSGPIPNAINTTLLLALGYSLLRLVEDFAPVLSWLPRAALGGLIGLGATAFLFPPPRPVVLTLLQLAYLIGALVYATVAFIRATRHATGVTSRRMLAMAAGCLVLGLLFVISTVSVAVPALAPVLPPLTNLAAAVSAICYFVGVVPPATLRRTWQEPELRRFLERAARLPRLPDTAAICQALEQGAATSVGAPVAHIGLWDAQAGVLRFDTSSGPLALVPTAGTPTGQAFLDQQACFIAPLPRNAPLYAALPPPPVQAVLAAPITAGPTRLGVLVVGAPRAPIFADEDLALVELLAAQAAVILESRALIDEAARVQAREEVTRLKEDFLSAAAHDLKTPLTTLVALTELLERRALRTPDAPADLSNLQMLKREVFRLRTLVLDLLDAAQAEQGRIVGARESVNLVALAEDTAGRHTSASHRCRVVADGPVWGVYDPRRIAQLLENLVENGIKYSPAGGSIVLTVGHREGWNYITVADPGIGIPVEDQPHVFERFHRGRNVDDRRFAGMGLGLYICRGIVEQHGGRIWVDSAGRGGSTFHVELPIPPEPMGDLRPVESVGATGAAVPSA